MNLSTPNPYLQNRTRWLILRPQALSLKMRSICTSCQKIKLLHTMNRKTCLFLFSPYRKPLSSSYLKKKNKKIGGRQLHAHLLPLRILSNHWTCKRRDAKYPRGPRHNKTHIPLCHTYNKGTFMFRMKLLKCHLLGKQGN